MVRVFAFILATTALRYCSTIGLGARRYGDAGRSDSQRLKRRPLRSCYGLFGFDATA